MSILQAGEFKVVRKCHEFYHCISEAIRLNIFDRSGLMFRSIFGQNNAIFC